MRNIFINGEVITVNQENDVVQAIVIEDNKIIYVGDNDGALKFKNSTCEVIDLNGCAVTPGFIDSHVHMAVSAIEQTNLLELSEDAGVKSIEDIKAIIKKAAEKAEPGEWIIGNGYNNEKLVEVRHPNRWDLDEVAPHNPVLLNHTSGHMSASNTKTLEVGHLLDGKISYEENDIIRDENNEPTGLLKEAAHFKMFKNVPIEPSDSVIIDGIEKMCNNLLAFGVTSSHDAGGFDKTTFRTLQKANDSKRLKNRVYPMLWSMYGKEAQIENAHTQINSGFYTGLGDDMLKIGPIKIMVDGSSCGGTCATREPLSHNGEMMPLSFTQEEADEIIIKAHKNNFQVTAHAIGDRAIECLLNSYEKAQKLYPREDCRHRIEHAAICQPDLIDRIKVLGIIPIPNPGFIGVWGSIYTKLYGERCEYVFPVADYIKNGVVCAFGSDALALSDYRPLFALAAAMDRKDTTTGEIIYAKQGVSILDAIRCYTYNGAYASFDEKVKGSLEVGKLADIVILSDSILDKTPDQIREMHVEQTILDGEVVYKA